MKRFFTLTLLLVSLLSAAQNIQEKALNSSIEAVTVFVNSAQVQRSGRTTVPAGTSKVVLGGLPSSIDPNNIQVKASGAITLLAVNHMVDYLAREKMDATIEKLQGELEQNQDDQKNRQAELSAVKETRSMLDANKQVNGENSTVAQLKAAVDYFSSRMEELFKKELEILKDLRKLQERQQEIQNQLNELNASRNRPTSRIEIGISARSQTTAGFEISYMVSNCSWTNLYDLRVNDIGEPVSLNYKAEVYQNSGEDWENVELTLSNANPRRSATAPQLTRWNLDFIQPYYTASPRAKSARPVNRGAVEMAAAPEAMLDMEESPLAEAAPLPTTIQQTQTATEITVNQPYTIRSGGDVSTVDLQSVEIPAKYKYYTVPKLDKEAFLIARITGWNQYNLLPGMANLYFQGTYVGKSYLDLRSFSDTLKVSLGRDQNIQVKREKEEQYSRKRLIGGNKVESRGFRITVRNNKSRDIEIDIHDQVPVSNNSDIAVSHEIKNGGKLNPSSGEITWNRVIPAGSQVELEFSYEVKYPKDRNLPLE